MRMCSRIVCSSILLFMESSAVNAALYSNTSVLSSTPTLVQTGTASTTASWSSADFVSSSNISVNTSLLGSTLRSANTSWAAIESCNAVWQTYLKDHVTTSSWPAVVTEIYSYIDYFQPVNATPYTTLCDGTPRAHGIASWDYETKTEARKYSSTATITDFEAPTPTCSIDSKDCARLWYNWYDKSGWNASYPGCPSTCDGSLYTTDYMGQPMAPCYINADELQLAYWPVTVEGNLCGNRSTLADGAATPKTASIWGTTITSPGVLVSFHSIRETENCGSTYGEVSEGHILPQQISQISTQCGAYHQVSLGSAFLVSMY